MRKLFPTFLLYLLATSAFAQWTEPVPMVPQPGNACIQPWISNDGLRLYFGTVAPLAMMIRDSIDGPWSEPIFLPDHINMTTHQRSPCESPSGDTLYFMSFQRPDVICYGGYDIYYSVRTDTGWGPVFNAGPNVNSQWHELTVGISRDGSILIVSSQRWGTWGEGDIFFHEKQSDGTWGPPIHLGPEVNTWEGEEHASLSSDNCRLFFYRVGPNSGDIWESRKINGIWQQAVDLPAPLNGPSPMRKEHDPCMAMDGRTLWFVKETGEHIYEFVTSIDTTVISTVSEPTARPHVSEAVLQIASEGSGVLRLQLDNVIADSPQTVVIYDLLGREAKRAVVTFSRIGNGSGGEIGMDNLPSGSYVITVQLKHQSVSAKYIKVN